MRGEPVLGARYAQSAPFWLAAGVARWLSKGARAEPRRTPATRLTASARQVFLRAVDLEYQFSPQLQPYHRYSDHPCLYRPSAGRDVDACHTTRVETFTHTGAMRCALSLVLAWLAVSTDGQKDRPDSADCEKSYVLGCVARRGSRCFYLPLTGARRKFRRTRTWALAAAATAPPGEPESCACSC